MCYPPKLPWWLQIPNQGVWAKDILYCFSRVRHYAGLPGRIRQRIRTRRVNASASIRQSMATRSTALKTTNWGRIRQNAISRAWWKKTVSLWYSRASSAGRMERWFGLTGRERSILILAVVVFVFWSSWLAYELLGVLMPFWVRTLGMYSRSFREFASEKAEKLERGKEAIERQRAVLEQQKQRTASAATRKETKEPSA